MKVVVNQRRTLPRKSWTNIWLSFDSDFPLRRSPRKVSVPVVEVLALAAHEVDALEDVDNVVNPPPLHAQLGRCSVQTDLGNLVVPAERLVLAVVLPEGEEPDLVAVHAPVAVLGVLVAVLRRLGVLLGHLLLLDGARELRAVLEVRERHVVQQQVEVAAAVVHLLGDLLRHLVTAGQQLHGVVLGHDGLEHLVAHGRQDTVGVVGAVLGVLGARARADEAVVGAHVQDRRVLEERDLEMTARWPPSTAKGNSDRAGNVSTVNEIALSLSATSRLRQLRRQVGTSRTVVDALLEAEAADADGRAEAGHAVEESRRHVHASVLWLWVAPGELAMGAWAALSGAPPWASAAAAPCGRRASLRSSGTPAGASPDPDTCPDSRTRRAAARTQDALVEPVQSLAVLDGLHVLHFNALRLDQVQPRLDRRILVVEVAQICHEVADDEHVRKRVDPNHFLTAFADGTHTSKRVPAVDVHRARAADGLTARATKRQRRVLFALDLQQRIQHHRVALVQIHGICQLVRLRLSLRLPAVDLEILHTLAFRRARLEIRVVRWYTKHAEMPFSSPGSTQRQVPTSETQMLADFEVLSTSTGFLLQDDTERHGGLEQGGGHPAQDGDGRPGAGHGLRAGRRDARLRRAGEAQLGPAGGARGAGAAAATTPIKPAAAERGQDPQRVCACCFDDLQKQLNVRALERVTRTGGAYPYIDSGDSTSNYSNNSTNLHARYRRRSKSVYSEPVQRHGLFEWGYDNDDDNNSDINMNGFAPVPAPWNWSTAASEAVESLQPSMGSMFLSVAPAQPTVLERQRLLRERQGHSMESEPDPSRRRSRARRPRPHSSALDRSLHVQRLSEVDSCCSSDEQELEQRMQQLMAAKRELGEAMRRSEEEITRAEREKRELDAVANKYRESGYSSPPEDEDEDEEAEIAATLAFLNGGRRMSSTADLLEEMEPPLD
ncbi:hypothetical protein ON010_g7343 [Phytophthora cinnamomi]|nr:hypothetical protein ON010_g7343 [Phytophthora cinnamomi]